MFVMANYQVDEEAEPYDNNLNDLTIPNHQPEKAPLSLFDLIDQEVLKPKKGKFCSSARTPQNEAANKATQQYQSSVLPKSLQNVYNKYGTSVRNSLSTTINVPEEKNGRFSRPKTSKNTERIFSASINNAQTIYSSI